MKKIGALAILFLLLFSLVPLSLAEETETTEDSELSKIENGFSCLENTAGDCSGLSTQDIALTILATPDNIFDSCVSELENRKTLNHWTTIQDTALAILALKHAGKDTKLSEEWLLTQEKIPTELTWYIQQDSSVETDCSATYGGNSYQFEVGADKKIDTNPGNCLDREHFNFWLEIDSGCYDEDFSIRCDENFIATLLYQNSGTTSGTLYILEGTTSASALDTIDLKVKSKCFGSSSSCNYETTAWAALALLGTGYDIQEYIPYLIATSDSNAKYLPKAFIYMLTNYDDYATQLIAEQNQLASYWDISSPSNTKYYDTALALIALGSSPAEQITNAKEQLLSDQAANGCWSNTVKDTAIVLWALTGRAGKTAENGDMSYCSETDYFCIPSYDCPGTEKASGYFCSSPSEVCCIQENLKSCSEYYGEECESNENCIGNKRKATDTDNCCTGNCKEKSTETECEENFYTCMDSCSSYQEPMSSYACDNSQVCCRTKTTDTAEKSTWWIWVLIILILATLGVIGYIYRGKLKPIWLKIKSKFKKGKGKGGVPPRRPGPGMPPRPGFPPVRRPRPPVAPMRRRPAHQDRAMADTFKKLKEMSS